MPRDALALVLVLVLALGPGAARAAPFSTFIAEDDVWEYDDAPLDPLGSFATGDVELARLGRGMFSLLDVSAPSQLDLARHQSANTELASPPSTTVYFRQRFLVPPGLRAARLVVDAKDGFAVYVDGDLFATENLRDAEPTIDTIAEDYATLGSSFDLSEPLVDKLTREVIVGISVHLRSSRRLDLFFDASIELEWDDSVNAECWPHPRASLQGDGAYAGASPLGPEIRTRWSLTDFPAFRGNIVTDGHGRLFAAPGDSVAAFNLSTGDLLWRTDNLRSGPIKALALDDTQSLLVVRTGVLLIAFRTNDGGQEAWRAPVDPLGRGLLLLGEKVIVPANTVLAAHALTTGRRLWALPAPVNGVGSQGYFEVPPIASPDRSRIFALVSNLSLLARVVSISPGGQITAESADIFGAAQWAGGLVLARSEKVLIAVSSSGDSHALDSETLLQRWSTSLADVLDDRVTSPIALGNGVFTVSLSSNVIKWVEVITGDLINTMALRFGDHAPLALAPSSTLDDLDAIVITSTRFWSVVAHKTIQPRSRRVTYSPDEFSSSLPLGPIFTGGGRVVLASNELIAVYDTNIVSSLRPEVVDVAAGLQSATTLSVFGRFFQPSVPADVACRFTGGGIDVPLQTPGVWIDGGRVDCGVPDVRLIDAYTLDVFVRTEILAVETDEDTPAAAPTPLRVAVLPAFKGANLTVEAAGAHMSIAVGTTGLFVHQGMLCEVDGLVVLAELQPPTSLVCRTMAGAASVRVRLSGDSDAWTDPITFATPPDQASAAMARVPSNSPMPVAGGTPSRIGMSLSPVTPIFDGIRLSRTLAAAPGANADGLAVRCPPLVLSGAGLSTGETVFAVSGGEGFESSVAFVPTSGAVVCPPRAVSAFGLDTCPLLAVMGNTTVFVQFVGGNMAIADARTCDSISTIFLARAVDDALPLAAPDRLVLRDGHEVLAVDMVSTETVWATAVGDGALAAMALGPEHVLVADDAGVVTALDPADGTIVGAVAGTGAATVCVIALDSGRAAVVTADGTARLVDAAASEMLWQVDGAVLDDFSLISEHGRCAADADRDALVVANAEGVTALSIATGATLWVSRHPFEPHSGVTLTPDGRVLFVGSDQSVHALDIETGAPQMVIGNPRTIASRATSPVVVTGTGMLVVGEANGEVSWFPPKIGTFLVPMEPLPGTHDNTGALVPGLFLRGALSPLGAVAPPMGTINAVSLTMQSQSPAAEVLGGLAAGHANFFMDAGFEGAVHGETVDMRAVGLFGSTEPLDFRVRVQGCAEIGANQAPFANATRCACRDGYNDLAAPGVCISDPASLVMSVGPTGVRHSPGQFAVAPLVILLNGEGEQATEITGAGIIGAVTTSRGRVLVEAGSVLRNGQTTFQQLAFGLSQGFVFGETYHLRFRMSTVFAFDVAPVNATFETVSCAEYRTGAVPSINGTSCMCPAGTEAADGGSACTLCGGNAYSTGLGSAEVCLSCPPGMTTSGVVGATSIEACGCPEGQYFDDVRHSLDSLAGVTSACVVCPDGADCSIAGLSLTGLVPLPGHWREGPTSTEFVKCVRSGCPGGRYDEAEADGICEQGYEGTLCGVCSPGYFRTATACIECPADAWVGLVLALIVIAAVGVMIASVYINLRQPKTATFNYASTVAKQIVNYLHLVGLARSFSIPFPTPMDTLIEVDSAASNPMSSVYTLVDCVSTFSYSSLLLVAVATPPVILVGSWLYWSRRARRWGRVGRVLRTSSTGSTKYDVRSNTIPTVLIVGFLVYPFLLATIVDTFSCIDVGSDSFLIADMKVSCKSAEHRRNQAVAGVFLVLYGVGLPALAGAMLYRNRKMLHLPDVRRRYSFLFKGYTTKYYWFEIAVQMRKVAVILVASLFSQSSIAQAYAGTWVVAASLVVVMHARPYSEPFLYQLDVVALAVVWSTLQLGLFFADDDDQEGTTSTVLAVPLFFVHCAMVVMFFYHGRREVISLLASRRDGAIVPSLSAKEAEVAAAAAEAEARAEADSPAGSPHTGLPRIVQLGKISPVEGDAEP